MTMVKMVIKILEMIESYDDNEFYDRNHNDSDDRK